MIDGNRADDCACLGMFKSAVRRDDAACKPQRKIIRDERIEPIFGLRIGNPQAGFSREHISAVSPIAASFGYQQRHCANLTRSAAITPACSFAAHGAIHSGKRKQRRSGTRG